MTGLLIAAVVILGWTTLSLGALLILALRICEEDGDTIRNLRAQLADAQDSRDFLGRRLRDETTPIGDAAHEATVLQFLDRQTWPLDERNETWPEPGDAS